DPAAPTAHLRDRTRAGPRRGFPVDDRVRDRSVRTSRVGRRPPRNGRSEREARVRRQRELGFHAGGRRARARALSDPRADVDQDRMGGTLRGHPRQASNSRKGRRSRRPDQRRGLLGARRDARAGHWRAHRRAHRRRTDIAGHQRAGSVSLPYRSAGPRAQRHMTAALLLLVLDLVLVAGAVIFLLLVIIRRGRIVTNLGVALLLIVLAAALWYTSIRNAPPLP